MVMTPYQPGHQPLDAAPPEGGSALNFGAWAPHVLGHLQRIESSLSYQSRTMAVLETKLDNFTEKVADLDRRVVALEASRVALAVTDASRSGIVTGIRWLWGVVLALVALVGSYLINNWPLDTK